MNFHSQGASFKYFFIGCVLFIPGIICFFSPAFIVGLILAPIGFWLIFSPTAVIFELESSRYKQGLSIGRFVFGSWKQLTGVQGVYLDRIFETTVMGGIRAVSTTVRTRSFEIYLGPSPKFQLREVTDYNDAVKLLNEFAKKFGLPCYNLYKEKQDSAVERRKQRKR